MEIPGFDLQQERIVRTGIEMVLADQLYVPKEDLPPALRNRLVRLAAFQNPEFYRAQATFQAGDETNALARFARFVAEFPTNALTPVLGMSHHAGDVNCVLPGLNVISLSVDSVTTFAHVINVQADLGRPVTREQVLEALETLPRITVGQGLRTTADVAEHYQDLGRSRRDWPEIYVWAEGLRVEGSTVYATIGVHMESITIPETVDCIRAALGMQEDPWASILKTDRALGIAKGPQCYQHGEGRG